jgi:hypothetical protein
MRRNSISLLARNLNVGQIAGLAVLAVDNVELKNENRSDRKCARYFCSNSSHSETSSGDLHEINVDYV